MGAGQNVKHLRQILLWPVYLLPLDANTKIKDRWSYMTAPDPDNPWREIDDEFGDPAEFQQRHYNEFVSFLPPVQRFLYGQGIGHAVKQGYGESPIRVLRRSDVAQVRITLERDGAPVVLQIAHADLYFFYDIDVVILALEVFANDLPMATVQDVLYRFGRAYPAYWEDSGRGGNCPWKVDWIGRDGAVLSSSDYEYREKFLSFVCKHRAPATAAHWEFLLAPLVLYHSDRSGDLRYRQLEYYRMPQMVCVALDEPASLSRADHMRLGLGIGPGAADEMPIPDEDATGFEARHCHDSYYDAGPMRGRMNARFMASGHTLTLIGHAGNGFMSGSSGGLLEQFRHQYFLMFLIAHFQKAALRMFSDRLVATVSRLEVDDPQAQSNFRTAIRRSHENFLRFNHRYWFHEISNQAHLRELFARTRSYLSLDDLFAEVREELQDMGNYLDVEAMRRQNETVVRLTVVTTFGLIGTVTTGILGMNLIDWTDKSPAMKIVIFTAFLVPIVLLTFYTIVKSTRLSAFLDELSDEEASFWDRFKALGRVWWRRGKPRS